VAKKGDGSLKREMSGKERRQRLRREMSGKERRQFTKKGDEWQRKETVG
jgi:hypothetical protein